MLEDILEVALDEVSKRKLEASNKALLDPKSSNKCTYTFWTRYFNLGVREGNDIEFDALLSFSSHDIFCLVALKMA